MRAGRSHKCMDSMVSTVLQLEHIQLVVMVADECQNKYGNANAWRYCTRVFDLLTVAAVSVVMVMVMS